MTRSAAAEPATQRRADGVQPVGQGRDPGHVDAGLGQRAGQVAAVRVAGLAGGDLAADRQQHGRAERSGRRRVSLHDGSLRWQLPAIGARRPGTLCVRRLPLPSAPLL